jgi:hypothetical protein
MTISLLPLLQLQRDIYSIPRGWERFRTYLATITGGGDDLVLPPLVSMNPMAKEHVAAKLDELLALDAEGLASAAVAEAGRRLPALRRQLQLGLVVVDDVQGRWTNRYFVELAARFELLKTLERGWIVVPLWVSEVWAAPQVRAEVLAAVYRVAYMQRHGQPKTLQQMLDQEGRAALFAGAPPALLDPEDLDYSREVIAPYRDTTSYQVQFTCLFGDDAARSVGYPPLGLSPRAGFALAYHEAQRRGATPEGDVLS